MPTTTNFGWTTPADTDLVKDGAAAIRTLGSNIDTSLVDLKGGTSGQYLTKNSNTDLDYAWVTLSAGGMTLLSTTTLSGASTTISSISGSYKSLVLYIRNFLPATDNTTLRMRINGDTNSRYVNYSFNTANESMNDFTNASSWTVMSGVDNAVTQGFARVEIFDYVNTVTWKVGHIMSMGNSQTITTNAENMMNVSGYNQTGAITSLTFFADTGNITSGTVLLYGVA